MKLLDRYITRQFLTTFVLLVMGLPVLFLITDVTDNLDTYLARGLPMRAVLLSYVYFVPQLIFWSLPVAALVATVFTIGNMTRFQEIAASKAGGVSFHRLLAPIVAIAAVLSVATVGLGEVITSTNRIRAELLGERATSISPLRTDFVFRTEEGRTLSVRRLDSQTQTMNGIVVEREVGPEVPEIHQTAQTASWKPDEGWTLENGYLRLLEADGAERTFAFDGLRIRELREGPEDLLAEPKEPEEMRYAEMGRFIAAIERSGGDARELRVEQAQKISLPMAVLVIVIFGAPLATSAGRGGAAFGIGISLAVTMVYLMLFRVGTAVGSSGALPPLVAAWMPNALFLVGGLVLLTRVRT